MKRAALHGLAAVVLTLASVAMWHWRFVADPHPLPETRIDRPLVGWTCEPPLTHRVDFRDGDPVLVLERESPKDPLPAIRVWFGPLERTSHILIRCEARWDDVVVGNQDYMVARFSVHMRDAEGVSKHPPDHQIFGGLGSSGWRRYEQVLKLTDDMRDTGFGIAMLGKSGRIEVRDLSLTAVRQRPWVPFATSVAVLGWIALCASMIAARHPAPARPATLAAAVLVVAASWVLVFPQTKGLLHPLPRSFDIGETGTPTAPTPRPAPARPPAKAAPPQASAPKQQPKPTVPEKAEPSSAASRPAAEAPRESSFLHRTLRAIDRNFWPAHIILFTGFTLAILALTGSSSQWRLPLAVAFLSEIVPELTDHLGDWHDWTDLVLNVAGVAVAVVLWKRLPFLRRFHRGVTTPPRSAAGQCR